MSNINELPVYRQRERIVQELQNHQVIIVESPTGSGKTTGLPVILHEAGYAKNGIIGVTQPRRIAAVSVSEYIAKSFNTTVPGKVGYKMRFEDHTVPETEIKIMTDGILLQELKADEFLSRYSVIMVDEAHERSLNIDFILGLLKEILRHRRDFKVIVSSATINPHVFSDYFGDAPIVHIDSSPYPVELVYSPLPPRAGEEALQEMITRLVVARVRKKDPGDILVFLSGEKPIKDTIEMLESSPVAKTLHILPLYGRLTKEEQERVFDPPPKGKTKVVISTNIAETSVTIDGITTVIDSGLSKVNFYNPRTFTSSLVEGPISRASCDQRTGRAGRTAPGICYRLYEKRDYEHRDRFTLEEIYRTDLSEVVLRMAELGIEDFESFDFISPPGKPGIIGAVDTLMLLDALTRERQLTRVGMMMVDFPLLPRHSRILVEAIYRYPSVMEDVLIATSFLTTHTPFSLPPGEEMEARKAHHRLSDPAGDFIAYISLFRNYTALKGKKKQEDFCKANYLDHRTMNEIVNIKHQLEEIVSGFGVPIGSGGSNRDILCAISAGLIQFVCVRTGRGTTFRSLTADQIQIHPGSSMFRESPNFIVAGEIVRTSRMFARSVSPLNRSWLEEINPLLLGLLSGKKGEKPGAERRDSVREAGRKAGSGGHKTPLGSGTENESTSAPRDTTSQILIGGKSFSMEKFKGKKKIAVLPWDELSELIGKNNELPEYQNNVRAKIVYGGYEIHPGERLSSLMKIVPFIDPPGDLATPPPGGKNYHAPGELEELCSHLEALLKTARTKKSKSKQLGFVALESDGVGVYWYKVIRSFHTAVDVSLSSLETLADELTKDTPKQLVEAVNGAYRRLNRIFEAY